MMDTEEVYIKQENLDIFDSDFLEKDKIFAFQCLFCYEKFEVAPDLEKSLMDHYYALHEKYVELMCKSKQDQENVDGIVVVELVKHDETSDDDEELLVPYQPARNLKPGDKRVSKQHANNIASFECKYCNEKLPSRYKLKKHEDNHDDLSVKCKICNAKFCLVSKCRQHIIGDHNIYKKIDDHIEDRLVIELYTTLTCKFCSKVFNSRTKLEDHEGLHVDPKYSCEFCDKSFYNITSRRLHIKAHHNNQDKGEDSEATNSSPENDVTCLISDKNLVLSKVFKPIEEADNNSKQDNTNIEDCSNVNSPLAITDADKTFCDDNTPLKLRKRNAKRKVANLNENIVPNNVIPEKSQAKKLKSTKIKKRDIISEQPMEIEEEVDESIPYCSICKIKFGTLERLDKHKYIHLFPSLKCNICEIMFDIKFRCRQHLAKEHGIVGTYKQNEYISDNRGRLMREVKPKCKNEEEAQETTKQPETDIQKAGGYICDICGKQIQNKTYFLSHLDVHKGVKYQCDLCESFFPYKWYMVQHMKMVHLQIRNHKCDLCGKAYKDWLGLRYHKNSAHSNERPFKCDFCDSSFKAKQHLVNHTSTVHYGQKRFKCKPCGKAFTKGSGRKKHNKSTHGIFLTRIPLNDDEPVNNVNV